MKHYFLPKNGGLKGNGRLNEDELDDESAEENEENDGNGNGNGGRNGRGGGGGKGNGRPRLGPKVLKNVELYSEGPNRPVSSPLRSWTAKK